jgi:hypothetical protein
MEVGMDVMPMTAVSVEREKKQVGSKQQLKQSFVGSGRGRRDGGFCALKKVKNKVQKYGNTVLLLLQFERTNEIARGLTSRPGAGIHDWKTRKNRP